MLTLLPCLSTKLIVHQIIVQVRETKVFQLDLQYPPAKDRPAAPAPRSAPAPSGAASLPSSTPASPDAKAAASAASSRVTSPTAAAAAGMAGGTGGEAGGAARLSFADLMERSLKTQSEMRAWFDEEVRAPLIGTV